jgi:putative transposase
MADEVKLPLKTLKYRVKDRTSGKKLDAAARAVNLVWNHCNGAQRHALTHNQRWPNKATLQHSTAGAGKLIGIPAQTVQEVCDEYVDRRRGSRKAKLRWRGKRSLGWIPFKNQTIAVKGSIVSFNGCKIRLWLHREIVGKIKSGSFSQDARGRWYCNVVVEYEPTPHGRNAEVGIDLGLKEGMTLSTGAKVENSRMFAKHEQALGRAQRGCKKRRVQAIHAKIANSRKDFLHKETTKIAKAFGLICVGNVSGRWLQATNGKSSADASTGMSRNMLRYKAITHGAAFVDTSEHLSTQTCSECGCVGGPKGTKGLEIREWTCDDCGAVHDRDVNAARNILRLGRQTLVEGSSSHTLLPWLERTSRSLRRRLAPSR